VRTVNLGILAHVDAGKTTLTERLLHAAGVIDEPGSVDDGSTQTDSLALERERGITIKAAVVSFAVGDVTVNLIDTPGHPDFIAEVERVLNVLDGAVLVVSAVEGVQAQTRVLMRALQRLRIPALFFVNKMDRRGASYDRTVAAIADKLTPAVVPVTDERRVAELAAPTRQSLAHPAYAGSAITGAGVDALIGGITELLPAARHPADGPVAGTVFKVERGPSGEKIAFARMRSGTLRTRDRLAGGQKVTAISVFDQGEAVRRPALAAGQIGKLWGLRDIRIGDAIGEAPPEVGRSFAPPTLETVVVPLRPEDRGALHVALTQLAEQDPLIDLRQDEELVVSLYGEVQKEVIQATLADEYGVDVAFERTATICIERPAGTGAAFQIIDVEPNPFLATVGLRVDPAPLDSGVDFRLEVELGSMPGSFFKAVEESAREALRHGVYGWEVKNCTLTMTHSGYWAKQSHSHAVFDKSMSSTAGDFRGLTPLVLRDALRRAGTHVYEPLHRFRLEAPADTLGAVFGALARLLAVPGPPELRGEEAVIEGDIPAARVHELEQQLPALTRGEGFLESEFARYQAVRGPVPTRPVSADRR